MACLDSGHGPCKPLLFARHTFSWHVSNAHGTRKAAEMTEKSGKTFELKDAQSGKSAQLPVRAGTVGPAAVDISNLYRDFDVFTYDPGYGGTAATESKI